LRTQCQFQYRESNDWISLIFSRAISRSGGNAEILP
jgi:hypothetical protein